MSSMCKSSTMPSNTDLSDLNPTLLSNIKYVYKLYLYLNQINQDGIFPLPLWFQKSFQMKSNLTQICQSEIAFSFNSDLSKWDVSNA